MSIAQFKTWSLFITIALAARPKSGVWVPSSALSYDDKICQEKGLDCSATCCLGLTCAEDIGDCEDYSTRSKVEIFIGVISLVILLLMFPVCIRFCNCCLSFRCCTKYNEENDETTGGITFCECLKMVFCCECCCRKNRQ